MKTLSSYQLTNLAKPHVYTYFIRIALPSTTLYLCSSDENRERNGRQYLGGKLQKIPAIKQTAIPNAQTLKLSIEAVSFNLPALLLSQTVNQSPVHFELVYFDQQGHEMYSETDQFTIDSIIPSDAKGIWSTLVLSNNWAAYKKTAGRVTNNASQAAHYPEDTDSFDREVRVLNWGREGPPTQVIGQSEADIYDNDTTQLSEGTA